MFCWVEVFLELFHLLKIVATILSSESFLPVNFPNIFGLYSSLLPDQSYEVNGDPANLLVSTVYSCKVGL